MRRLAGWLLVVGLCSCAPHVVKPRSPEKPCALEARLLKNIATVNGCALRLLCDQTACLSPDGAVRLCSFFTEQQLCGHHYGDHVLSKGVK